MNNSFGETLANEWTSKTVCESRADWLKFEDLSNRDQLVQDGDESILHFWMQNDLIQFELFIDCLSFTNTLGSAFLKNCGLVVPNFLCVFASLYNLPQETVRKF